MARFEDCIDFVLRHEGGYSNRHSNPGGVTKFGISLKLLTSLSLDINGDGLVDERDIQMLDKEDAKYLYKKYFWDPYPYEHIKEYLLARKVLDMSVHAGPKTAARLLQIAINRISETAITVDGVLGPITVSHANKKNKYILLCEYRESCAHFYRNLVADKPNLKPYLDDFMFRAYD